MRSIRSCAIVDRYSQGISCFCLSSKRLMVAFGAIFPRARPLLWTYALLIAVSRVVVTAHYPSDVIAGAALGGFGALWVRDWFAVRRLGFCVGSDGHVHTLPGPSVVARLVLGADQGVGPAALIGRQIQVAASPGDRALYVTACSFGGFEGPHPTLGIGQKMAEFCAVAAAAGERVRPPPVFWRFQRLRDAGT